MALPSSEMGKVVDGGGCLEGLDKLIGIRISRWKSQRGKHKVLLFLKEMC